MTDAQRKLEVKRLREENKQLHEMVALHELVLQSLLEVDENENIVIRADRETIDKIKEILRNATQ